MTVTFDIYTQAQMPAGEYADGSWNDGYAFVIIKRVAGVVYDCVGCETLAEAEELVALDMAQVQS